MKKPAKNSKVGAPRKYKYKGVKKNVTIRLTDEEKELIRSEYPNIQAFIQANINKIKKPV